MLRFASDRVYRVYSRWFAGVVFLCSATLHVCQTMYRSKQFCAWHATSETEFHTSQLARTVGSSSHYYLATPDLFRLWPISWRRAQLCPGSGRVENVRYGLLDLALTTTTENDTHKPVAIKVKFGAQEYRGSETINGVEGSPIKVPSNKKQCRL